MDKMTLARCIDLGTDVLASLLLVYILVIFILKKRKLKKQMEEQESTQVQRAPNHPTNLR